MTLIVVKFPNNRRLKVSTMRQGNGNVAAVRKLPQYLLHLADLRMDDQLKLLPQDECVSNSLH